MVFPSPLAALDDAAQGVMSSSLEGRQWRLSQFYSGDRSVITLPLRVPLPYLDFRDGRIGGSTGCGQFTGTYRRTDDKLAVLVTWVDDTKSPCSGEQKNEVAEILHALTSVRVIRPVSDALLLQDGGGALQVRLAAMQPGEDLSEVHNNFWLLKQIDTSTQDLSQIVVEIEQTGITFTTPTYLLGIPFQYHLQTGLQFYKPYAKGGNSESQTYLQDQQVANSFESAIHNSKSYKLINGELTFLNADQHPIIVLNSLHATGIENRVWRIVKYRIDRSSQPGEEGLIDATEAASVLFTNGRVEGSSGLGIWAGTYKLSRDSLTFDAASLYAGVFTTEQAEQGYNIEKDLKGQRLIQKKGNDILIYDEDGNVEVFLVPF